GQSGVHTFRKRQSSRLLSSMRPPAFWAQGAPKVTASRMPLQGFIGKGGRQRRLPTGGWAKGMPLKTAPPRGRAVPRIEPDIKVTTGSVAYSEPANGRSRASRRKGRIRSPPLRRLYRNAT